MKANYHSHTARCHHASGTEREYVEAAIKSGIKVLGFADHSPYPFPEDHAHQIRMRMHELDSYVNTILALKEEYRSDIDIHLGLEVEYFPAYFEQLRREIADYPIEYFLLAQHILNNGKTSDFYCGAKTDEPANLIAYCDQILAGMDTGCFTYLAHPDLPNFLGDPVLYDTQMRRICRRAKELSLPLEINFLGLAEGRHYPTDAFWKIAGEEKCDLIFGLDAHHPKHFQFEPQLVKAHAIAEKYSLHLLEDIDLIKPI